MLRIKVWCLPAGQTEGKLKLLHRTIVAAVVAIKEIGFRNENDMTCLFVPDLMTYGLGQEIIIEIDGLGLFAELERTIGARHTLAASVGSAVKGLYPKAKVNCTVSGFDRDKGFWISPTPRRSKKDV
jgi:hypothetical protein